MTSISSSRQGDELNGNASDSSRDQIIGTATPSNAEKKNVDVMPRRSAGAYIPPARLRLMQQQQLKSEAPDSEVVQRISWEALKKSINGLINKVNSANIRAIIPELFSEDLIRGKGLFCKSLMKAQSFSIPFTPVYAAVVSVVNSRMPMVGELLIKRIIYQFRRAYNRNDRAPCLSLLTLLAHLTNQGVVTEILCSQIIILLLERPTSDSVELAVGLLRECGQYLTEINPKIVNLCFDRFRSILHQGEVDKRVQYMIEVLFQVRKDKFKDNPAIPEDLDLVEEDNKISHMISLDEEDIDPEELLNVFTFDPDYLEHQEAFQSAKAEILGSDDEEESGSGSEEESDSEEQEVAQKGVDIIDKTGTNLVNLRRTIYLTVMSSLDYEECAHKLLKMNIAPEDEVELCSMIVECCSQERTYTKFFGNLGERFCKINRKWAEHFEHVFQDIYETIHRYETNKLRSIAKFFSHLFSNDGIPMPALGIISLTEDTTTASSRIFVKILFQELVGSFGLSTLNKKLKDPALFPAIQEGLFPMDNPKNTRFAINYYTSIGLGELTEELRDHLQKVIADAAAARALKQADSSDSSDSESDSDSSSDSDSDSDSSSASSIPSNRKQVRRDQSVTPPRNRYLSRDIQRRDSFNGRSPRRNFNRKSPIRAMNRVAGRYNPSRSPSPRDRRSLRRPVSPIRRSISRSISRSKSPIMRRQRRSVSRSISPRNKSLSKQGKSRSPVRREPRGRPVSRSPNLRARRDAREVSQSPIRRNNYRGRQVSRSPSVDEIRGRANEMSISPRNSNRKNSLPVSPPRNRARGRSISRSISPPVRRQRSPAYRGRNDYRPSPERRDSRQGRSTSRSSPRRPYRSSPRRRNY
ncbi:MIF4G-domain-containing protein [Neoconidiobolus thromboides FSU 785]|nr:MIF4G-domain-containing protein [Neoconidiobolus thromboides FSU 785]